MRGVENSHIQNKWRWWLVGAVLAFLLALLPQPIQAQTNAELFDTQLHTTVTVTTTGQSRIKHQFTITNKTPTTYLSQYGLKISSDQLKNIAVVSDGQVIEPEKVIISADEHAGPGLTSIGITFPNKVVGEGKTRQFTLSYTHPDAAVISGSVLEITLPPQTNPEDYSKYSVTLITPANFGGPVRTTPAHHTFTASGNQIITNFNQGGENGIFALFGDHQIFNLNLEYQLINDTNNPALTQIALPPDTSHQRVFYHQLTPSPQEMEYDPDGNWIATYQLAAGSETVVKLQADVELTLATNSEIPVPPVTDQLLSAQQFWPVNDSQIKELTTTYNTPQKINDFVVETLTYSTQRALSEPERLGAVQALNQPTQAVCQEFTDLFITLARNVGVPARRVTGYAQAENNDLRPSSLVEDVLHAWPEYYDDQQQQWLSIDPTWENTTGGVDYFHQVDLNHIVFAINGHDSQLPFPAGSYKRQTDDRKTIQVEFGDSFPEITTQPPISFELIPQKILGLNLPGSYQLNITNNNGFAVYRLPISIDQSPTIDWQSPALSDTNSVETILPFQTREVTINFEHQIGLLPKKGTISITLGNESQQFAITSRPSLSQSLHQPKILAGVAVLGIISTLIIGSLLVSRRR